MSTPTTASDNEFVFDVTEADFNEKVVEKSMQAPVLIDFWADWCGPCKSLSPILEKLAKEYAGKFYLAKVNTEKAQQLAAYFQIKSIPDCRLIKDGQMLDGFTGALPEGQIRKFLDKHLVSEAEQMRLAAQEAEGDEKEKLLRAAQATEPRNPAVALDLAEFLLAKGDFEDVEALLGLMAVEKLDRKHEDRLKSLQARLAFAKQPPIQGDFKAWQERIEVNPKDFEARYEWAEFAVRQGDFALAFEQMIEVVRLDRAEGRPDRDKARKQLIEWFGVCTDPAAVKQARVMLGMYLN
jgi:putative thioredoxin